MFKFNVVVQFCSRKCCYNFRIIIHIINPDILGYFREMSQPMRVCIIGSGNWYVAVYCIKSRCCLLVGVILRLMTDFGRCGGASHANTCIAAQDR